MAGLPASFAATTAAARGATQSSRINQLLPLQARRHRVNRVSEARQRVAEREVEDADASDKLGDLSERSASVFQSWKVEGEGVEIADRVGRPGPRQAPSLG